MAGYDPQRTRHRPRPANGSAAPVDSILDGAADDEPEPESAEPGASIEAEGPASTSTASGPSSTSGDTAEEVERTSPAVDLTAVPPPPPGPSPARLLLAGGGLLALLVFLLLRRRRRRPDAEGQATDEG